MQVDKTEVYQSEWGLYPFERANIYHWKHMFAIFYVRI